MKVPVVAVSALDKLVAIEVWVKGDLGVLFDRFDCGDRGLDERPDFFPGDAVLGVVVFEKEGD